MGQMDTEGRKRFLLRVDALLGQRMFELAQELAEQRLQRLPDDVDARIAMCKTWTKMGKLDRVEEILKDVESRIADWSRLHASMGDICRESGLKKEALRFYRRFLDLNQQAGTQQTILEKMVRLMDDGAAASVEDDDRYEDITDIAPDFHTMTLAELYMRQNQPDMARNVLKEILRREPDHREAAARLRDMDDRGSAPQGEAGMQGHDRVLRELTRWLQNVGRIGSYAS
jgi:tetratricopeptide (TPR) repeat protein